MKLQRIIERAAFVERYTHTVRYVIQKIITNLHGILSSMTRIVKKSMKFVQIIEIKKFLRKKHLINYQN